MKDVPYGGDGWVEKIIKKYGLEQTLRGVGRPKKKQQLNGGCPHFVQKKKAVGVFAPTQHHSDLSPKKT